jgi:predicted Zn-dependent protease
MSKTLNLVDGLLSRGQNLHRHGLFHQAAESLKKLSTFRLLPGPVAEETQKRLADLALERRQFKQARRHLAAALAHQPDEAEYHYLMAVAVEDDESADSKRAGRHYRRALALDPRNPVYLCDFGVYLLDQGQTSAGLKRLRAAMAEAPDDPDIVRALAQALRENGETLEAERIVRLALFRNSRDHRFKALMEKHQFQVLHDRQHAPCKSSSAEESPVFLPFVRHKKETGRHAVGHKVVRIDGPSSLPGPKLPIRRRSPHGREAK